MLRRYKEASEEQTQDKICHQMSTEILLQSCSTKYCLCWPLHNANISRVINGKRFKKPFLTISELSQALEDQAADEGQWSLLSSDLLQRWRNKTTTREHLQNYLPKRACPLKAPANCALHNSHLAPSKAKITEFSDAIHGKYFISHCLLLVRNFKVQGELHKSRGSFWSAGWFLHMWNEVRSWNIFRV